MNGIKVTPNKVTTLSNGACPISSETAEDMFQVLLDAPIPLDASTLYAEWHRLSRRVIRQAAKERAARY